ncbi:MAG TPA: glutamine synthetase family protein [Acidimicrobiia bacterium]|jgi:glutamine synthetase|nr:glutamine synthetase family protein [Acidimicrobiia bacterium]
MDRQLEYVLRTVEERGVRFVRLWFTDVLGFLKSVEITPAELEMALEEGMTFDGSTIEGYSRIQESDMLAKPDANTFELLPGGDPEAPVARMFCDIQMFSGEPFPGDPRFVLKRNLERAREKGFTFFVGPEMEFFYSRSSENVEPLDTAGYFDHTANDLGSQLRKQTVLRLEAMGIPVEYSFHENGPSQHEIDLRHTDALTMADNVMTFRLVTKEVAQDLGVHATFMPKPIAGAFGSGMHSHLSLFEGDVNAFHDPGDEYGLSKVAKHFIAGLLVHASEIVAITNQWVNSYKRLIPGYEAPVYKCWARNNRSALVRVPLPKKDKSDSTRIEFRAPDPSCNPYLAFSVMLAAGLRGIEEGYALPAEATDNIYALSDAERLAEGISALPGSLRDALDAMERSELMAEALGEHVLENFLINKRREWTDYKSYVTPFEIDRSLGAL